MADSIGPRGRTIAFPGRGAGPFAQEGTGRGNRFRAPPKADNEFEALLFLDVLDHASDPHALVGEAARILNPSSTGSGLARETFGAWSCLPHHKTPDPKRRLAGHEQRLVERKT